MAHHAQANNFVGMSKLRLEGILQTRALIDPKTINKEERTVEVVFATDAAVRMWNWDIGTFNEILSFADGHVRWERLNAGAPVLDNHMRYGPIMQVQVGVVERAWTDDKKQGRALVRFSKREGVGELFQDIQDGIIRNVSVGYEVFKYQDESDRDAQIRTLRAIDWEPKEISFVTVPADLNAGVRSQGEQPAREVEIFSNTNNTRNMAEQNVTQPDAPTDKNTNSGTQQQAPTAAAVDEKAVRSAAIAEERKRCAEIRSLVRTAKLGEDFADQLIEKGVSVDSAREAIFNKWAESQSVVETRAANGSVVVTADETDKLRGVITTALVLRSGQIDTAKEFKPEEISAAREYRGRSLLEIARESLERSGVDTRGMDKMEIAKRALTSSTSDFPILLEGTNRRVLLAAYRTVADTWRRFCAVGSVGDFREYKRLRLGSFGKLDKMNENGEYKNKPISDAEFEKVSADTYGNVINITRKMIINDDLAGFTRLTAMLGRAAARSIEQDVYALLNSNPVMNDGVTLFHANHGNLVSGAAPSVDSVDAARVAMASQKDKDGNDFLDLRPAVWVGPIGMGGNVRVINDAQYDPDTPNKLQKPNKVRGLFRDIVDTPRLSGNAWYVFADPNDEPVIEVSFLDGVQEPFMDSFEPFNMDGIQWKVRLDYGVGAVGWRGAVKNPGA